MSVKGSGWANPVLFERAFRRYMDRLVQQYQRTAREYEFCRFRIGRQLTTAAYRYYGGYQTVCELYGYGRPYIASPRPQRTPQPRPMYGHWTQRENQIRVLRNNYRWYLDRGIFPPVSKVKADGFGGLANHWLRLPGGWDEAARQFRLRPYTQGMAEWRIVESIIEAVQYYEQHHRWPVATECSSKLRHRRFDTGIPWPEFLGQTKFHPRVIDILLVQWRKHYAWRSACNCQSNDWVHSIINSLVISQRHEEPFGRLEI